MPESALSQGGRGEGAELQGRALSVKSPRRLQAPSQAFAPWVTRASDAPRCCGVALADTADMCDGRRILWQFSTRHSRGPWSHFGRVDYDGEHAPALEPDFRNPGALKSVTTNGEKLIKLGLLPKVSLFSKVELFWNWGLCKLLLKQSHSLWSSLMYWNSSKNLGRVLVKLNRREQLLLEQ